MTLFCIVESISYAKENHNSSSLTTQCYDPKVGLIFLSVTCSSKSILLTSCCSSLCISIMPCLFSIKCSSYSYPGSTVTSGCIPQMLPLSLSASLSTCFLTIRWHSYEQTLILSILPILLQLYPENIFSGLLQINFWMNSLAPLCSPIPSSLS